MTKQYYTMQVLIKYLSDNDTVKAITVTKFNQFDFNTTEGNQITFNVNITTIEGYKNHRVSIYTNSSYFQWYELEETSDAIKTFLENLYI